MSADNSSAHETDTSVELPDHPSQPSASGQAKSARESQSDPTYEELRKLADQQEAQLVLNDHERAETANDTVDTPPQEHDGPAPDGDRDPTYVELRALAEQQDGDLAAETATDADAEEQSTGPSTADPPVKDEPREAVTDADLEPVHEEFRAFPDEQDANLATDEPEPVIGGLESRIEGQEMEGGPSGEASYEEPPAFAEQEEIGLDGQAEEDVEQPVEPKVQQEGRAREPDIDDDPTYEELRALAKQQDAELATEGEGLASPDSSGWAEQLAEFEQAWREHEARWPEESEAVGAADGAGDEPGSWRGDGGQYLNAEENIVTGHHHERVVEARLEVTDAITAIRSDVPGADLVGLEYQLKGIDRYKEKVAGGLADMPERAVEQVTAQIPDALRYTYQFDKNDYTKGYRGVCRHLEERGYQMELSRNSWNNEEYKGINTRWRTEGGQMFEVQFHTPESFEAKQLTHGAYERARNPLTGDLEAGDLSAFQAEVSRHIPRPDQVEEIDNYTRKKG